jgi:hypothetical protein
VSIIETVVPARLGTSFRWLLASSWTTNIGDGIALSAGPLLVASRTDNPTLVALAALLQRLPWLLFGLYAGVQADRLDRRRLVMAADGIRVVVIGLLCAAIATGRADVTVVLVTMFLLGTAETFADTTTPALLPMVVDKRDLGIANSRIFAGGLTANQLVGPPIGAGLFALGNALPFVTQGVLVALGVVLVSRVVLPAAVEAPVERVEGLVAEIREGMRWVWEHKPVRTLALTILTFNVT